jgi:signal transduction histidine kinase
MTVVAVGVPVLAAACCVVGLVALRMLRLRLELVGRAEHELRGPATALSLACQQMRHDPAAVRHADVLEAQLERLRAGLDDLAAARRGGRKAPARGGRVAAKTAYTSVEVASFVRAALEPWRPQLRRCSVDLPPGTAVAVADRGRLAQTLGNLLANSAEHGAGDLRVRGRRVPGAIRLEVRNENRAAGRTVAAGERGRGLAIAAGAARDLGGRLLVHREESATVAVLELPDGGELRSAVGDQPPGLPGDPAEPDAVA